MLNTWSDASSRDATKGVWTRVRKLDAGVRELTGKRAPSTRAFIVVIGSERGTEEAYSTRVTVQTVPRSTGPLTLRRCVNVSVLPSIVNSYTS